jgi:hypothetical protein
MLHLDTTSNIALESLLTLLSRRILGHVRIQRCGSIYLLHCQPTPEYHDVLDIIHTQGGYPLLVDGHVFVLQTLSSKL